jgi:hypothetical protein
MNTLLVYITVIVGQRITLKNKPVAHPPSHRDTQTNFGAKLLEFAFRCMMSAA